MINSVDAHAPGIAIDPIARLACREGCGRERQVRTLVPGRLGHQTGSRAEARSGQPFRRIGRCKSCVELTLRRDVNLAKRSQRYVPTAGIPSASAGCPHESGNLQTRSHKPGSAERQRWSCRSMIGASPPGESRRSCRAGVAALRAANLMSPRNGAKIASQALKIKCMESAEHGNEPRQR